MRFAALASLLAACSSETVELRIIIDSPPVDSPASAFPDLDTVELSVALAGAQLPLTTQTFKRGQDIELPDVPYGENLVIHMIGRVGAGEVAVGRTCPFSVRIGEDPPSPHLYFARIFRWAPSFQPTSATRGGATALTDFEGNGLYIGGVNQESVALSGIDRFDTMNGLFEQVTEVVPRRGGAAAQLGDGRIVILGGTTQAGVPSTDIDIVDLNSTQRPVSQLGAAEPLIGKTAPALATTSDGAVVAFGGGDDKPSDSPRNTIVDIRGAEPAVRELTRARLAIARKQHTVTRLSDDIGAPMLIVGGLDASGTPIARAELYKPLIEEMATGFQPNMITPRRDHQAVRLPDGSVLIVGGVDATGKTVDELEIFNFDSGFQPAGLLPGAAGVTDFTVTPLPDGSILLAGGRNEANEPVTTSFIFRLDSSDGELDVLTTDRLASARAGHQATLLCDGTVMLVGGTLFSNTPAERYNPDSKGRR